MRARLISAVTKVGSTCQGLFKTLPGVREIPLGHVGEAGQVIGDGRLRPALLKPLAGLQCLLELLVLQMGQDQQDIGLQDVLAQVHRRLQFVDGLAGLTTGQQGQRQLRAQGGHIRGILHRPVQPFLTALQVPLEHVGAAEQGQGLGVAALTDGLQDLDRPRRFAHLDARCREHLARLKILRGRLDRRCSGTRRRSPVRLRCSE